MDALGGSRDKVKAEADKVYALHVAGEIIPQGFGARYRPLEDRLAQVDDELPRLQGELDFLKIRRLSADDLVSQAQSLYGRWDELSFEEKRQIVETLVERVTVGRDGISFDLNYLPPGAGAQIPPESETMVDSPHTDMDAGATPAASRTAPRAADHLRGRQDLA